MTGVDQASYAQSVYQNAYAYGNSQKMGSTKAARTDDSAASKTSKAADQDKKISVDGPGTYGDPKLSKEALDYYNDLKKRYGNLNFVLVSSDKKQQAEMMKGSFASAGSLTVLIDTDKIEQMAADETYRAKYEGIIANAVSGLNSMKAQMGSAASQVKAYGMTVNKDGTASYFAVIDKSLAAQRERIKEHAKKKAEDKKAAAQKSKKEEAQERLDNRRKAQREDEDTITVTADSIEELMRKIEEYYQDEAFGRVRTESEKQVGHQVDYSA